MQIKEITSLKEFGKIFDFLLETYKDLSKKNCEERISNLLKNNYKMAVNLDDKGKIKGFIGAKISEKLSSGKILEIEDFIIDWQKPENCGAKNLLNWVENLAKESDCKFITASAATIRTDIQKFFSTEKFIIEGLLFKKI
jgi:hypothetical protein